MARPIRIEYPGALYHITSRGNERKAIYYAESDRCMFLEVLASTIKKYNWICHAYCLMDNHYHLLIETPDPNLSLGMRQLNGVYTQRFNYAYKRVGHLFQGRFKAILVEKQSYLLALSRYIVLNPVRAGITVDPKKYQWSSYRCALGLENEPVFLKNDWILQQFSDNYHDARRWYEEFVLSAINKKSPLSNIKGQVLLGNKKFIENMSQFLIPKRSIKEIPKQQRYANRPPLEMLLQKMSDMTKTERNERIKHCHIDYGYSIAAISKAVGLHYSTVSNILKHQNR